MSQLKVPYSLLRSLPSLMANSLSRIQDTVLPPHSLITGRVLSKDDLQMDTELWQSLKFIDDPCCTACGFPFEFEQGVDALCMRCHAHMPIFDHARSAITYDDISRKLVLDFKYGGRTDGLEFFAAQMMRAGSAVLDEADTLIPVPLHPSRLRQRRFNQAALLARTISRLSAIPYQTEALVRRKNTPSQGGLTFLGRRRNVSGAFNMRPNFKDAVKGQHVVLIDDVYTTGSTLSACANPLKRAGARRVDALTLMRVVRPQEIPK